MSARRPEPPFAHWRGGITTSNENPSEPARTLPRPVTHLPSEDRLREVLSTPLFVPAQGGDPRPPPRLIIDLAQALLRIHCKGSSEVALYWPTAPDVSVIYPLGCLALLLAPELQTSGYRERDIPAQFRALYFPWTSRTGTNQQTVLVNRDAIYRANIEHLRRYHISPRITSAEIDGWRALHQALIRVKDLSGKVTHERYKRHVLPEFQHPALMELVPQGRAGEANPERKILYRVRKHTVLSQMSQGNLDDPKSAPYMLFGIHRDDAQGSQSLRRVLARIHTPIHAVIIDATRRTLNSTGGDWYAALDFVLAGIRDTYGSLPVLAVTDEPYIQHALATSLLPTYHGQPKREAVPKWARHSSRRAGTFLEEPALFQPSGAQEILPASFSGIVTDLVSRIRSLRAKARSLPDPEGELALRDLQRAVRRCARLATGVDALSDFVFDRTDQDYDTTRELMEQYDLRIPLQRLTDKVGSPLALSAPDDVRELDEETRVFQRQVRKQSPMAQLLRDALKKALEHPSQIVVVLPSAMEAAHTQASLSDDSAIGAKVREQLEAEKLRFIDLQDLSSELEQDAGRRMGTTILVAPSPRPFLEAMAHPSLPNQLVLLSDVDHLRQISDHAERLSGIPEFNNLATRFTRLAKATQEEVVRRSGRHIPLSLDDLDLDEYVSPSRHSTINLANEEDGRNGPLILLSTRRGYRIRARPRTKLVLFDREAPANPFFEKDAQNVREGDELCVIGEEFEEMARATIDLRVSAEEVRAYHEEIRDRIAPLPGTISDKARVILEQIRKAGGKPPNLHQITNWIGVEQYLAEDVRTVQPHAPWHLEDFLTFTRAIGIPEARARDYWEKAILGTRSRRLSVGLLRHDAYRTILVKPYAALSTTPTRQAELEALRAFAERHVDTVEKVVMNEEP